MELYIEVIQCIPITWVFHLDQKKAPMIKATLLHIHNREKYYIIHNIREMTKSRQSHAILTHSESLHIL